MCDKQENWDPREIGGWKGFIKQLYRHHKPDGGALIIRLVIGILFVVAGWWKVAHIDMAIGYGLAGGFPAWSTIFVAWVELIGGALLVLGLLTKPVCVAFAIEMAVIIWGTPGGQSVLYFGHDYNFVLLGIFLALYIMGPGKYSLAHLWLIRKSDA